VVCYFKEERTTNQNGADLTISTEYSDYRKAGNILVPYKMNQSVQTPAGAQEFVITVKEVKINSGLKPTDFI
jgi:zinc protease